MKTNFLLFVCFLGSFQISAQKKVFTYDLKTGGIDSIPIPNFDTTVTADKTDFYVGDFDDEIGLLPDTEPMEDLFPDTRMTMWKKVSDDYDMSDFPMRTSAKMLPIEDNQILISCSGNMVSRRHLFTSAQCVMNIDHDTRNIPRYDSLLVCPGYNNGEPNADFGCSYAQKIYVFKDWSFDGEDMALVELEDPIGDQTGWLGVGFEENDSFFTQNIFHKFSYPTRFGFPTPPIRFNGDTIYHTYGMLEAPHSHFIWAKRNAMTGEEGSNLIRVDHEEDYTSYGTLSYLGTMLHGRIDPWEFAALKNAIAYGLSSTSEPEFLKKTLRAFPNPASDFFKIERSNITGFDKMILTDIQGKQVKVISEAEVANRIDISDLPSGMYFLTLRNSKGVFTGKVIKSEIRP